jgi:hypothetical protein
MLYKITNTEMTFKVAFENFKLLFVFLLIIQLNDKNKQYEHTINASTYP